MNQVELMKMITAQFGKLSPNPAGENSKTNKQWLNPFREKAKCFAETPYQMLAEWLIASAEKMDDFSAWPSFRPEDSCMTSRDPFAEHPELIDELLKPENSFLNTFWEPEWAQFVARCLEYRLTGTYQVSFDRKPFRSQMDKSLYPIAKLLKQLFLANHFEPIPEKWALDNLNNPLVGDAISPALAVLLDSGNPEVAERIRSAVYENTGTVSSFLLLALFYSKQESCWKTVSDLLLAAKLQEGVRQSILECCSIGRAEAFLYIMHVMADHDLFRFPACRQAFGQWIGLYAETVPENAKAMFCSALNVLRSPEMVQPQTFSDIFLHLWALAVREVRSAQKLASDLLEAPQTSEDTFFAAALFYRLTGDSLSIETALRLLIRHRESPIRMACVFSCFSAKELSGLPKTELIRLYWAFKELFPFLPGKVQNLSSPGFSWIGVHLSCDVLLLNVLLPLARKIWEPSVLNDLIAMMKTASIDVRQSMVFEILEYLAPAQSDNRPYLPHSTDPVSDAERRKNMPQTPELRSVLLELLEDRSSLIRQDALEILQRMKLAPEELIRVENLLNLKTSAVRRTAMELLKKQKNVEESAARLRASGDPLKIAAANEIAPVVETAPAIDKEHGYGLYDVREIWNPPTPVFDAALHPAAILKDDPAVAEAILAEFYKLFDAHAHDECKCTEHNWNSGEVTKTLEQAVLELYTDTCWSSAQIANPPLAELWDTFFVEHPLNVRELVHAFLLLLNPDQAEVRKTFFRLSEKIKSRRYPGFLRAMIHRELAKRPDYPAFAEKCLIATVYATPETFWKTPLKIKSLLGSLQEYSPGENSEIHSVFFLLDEAECTPDAFTAYERLAKFDVRELAPSQILQAFDQGFITQNTMRRLLLTGQETQYGLCFQRLNFEEHPEICKLFLDAVNLELTRGELPTALSKPLCDIRRLDGAPYFVRILNALGDRPFVRGYVWGGTGDRQNVFSHLLKVCRPLDTDTPEEFKKLLNPYKFSEKRLLEAAMYSPAWLFLVGKALKIPDLALAGWYFHAHLSERFDLYYAEKEANIGKYSPISPLEFKDGAFDIDWFREAYQAVGSEMFAKLYDAAKYISGGANHRRSQIFADAALGKLKTSEVETNMATKRNKEFVMAYGILPGTDFLHRYENLMKFKKETRQFGGQRQASEKLAVEIAVANLARTAGFSDVNRFLWRMEAAKLDELNALFAPHETDGVTLSLAIDSDGRAEIRVEKAGKELKSIPASLKKDAYVLELQSAVKSLRDQHSRAKKSLEEAMIREDVFEYAEVRELMSNPVLGPLVAKLLWQSGETIDFFENLPETPLKIAHPTGLLRSGRWAEFQRLAVERKLVQPFKQIFRELYTLNADEKLDGMKSRRYSGNQVMPKKTVALLRTRGWTVDMEEGLQKVFHKQNLIAKIYAIADWFSPSEVEPPTLEYVQFEHRRTGEIIPLEKIAPVMFSEVMRDLDLMVSVAHAGGVDPEASHSTVEMRAALVSALLPLFKLDNVRIEKSHAFITGKFGEYTVHLGSGVCHQQARGMLNILPVHSQTRGRLFLPFADDDPKTAEILTKILFLAEDTKIKDPNILEQIRGGAK